MFDVGGSELILIGVVALIVIGPKDLPEMFRQLGRITAKMRSMARDFQRAMDQAAKESGVADVANDLKTATSSKNLGLDAVREAANKFEKWDPIGNTMRPTAPAAATPPAPIAAATSPAPIAPSSVIGPATQALAQKQAQKKAILQEATAKLKAVDTATAPVQEKPAPKARVKAAKTTAVAAEMPAEVTKPRAPRKTAKKADTV